MKIFKNFTLIALAALFLTSCYKDDIANLQKQIDELSGTRIADIESQISGIKNSISDLQKTEEALGGYISSLRMDNETIKSDVNALKDAHEELGQKIADLKEYVDNGLKNESDWAKATFATLERYDSLCVTVADINVRIDKIGKDLGDARTEIVASCEKAVKESTAKCEESLKKWVNEQLVNYYTIAEIDARLEVMIAGQAGVDSLLAVELLGQKEELGKAKEELTEAYKKAIEEAVKEYDGLISKKLAEDIASFRSEIDGQIEEILEEIALIEGRLDEIEANIDALLSQIQSISVIPTYDDGSVRIIGDGDVDLYFEIHPVASASALATAWKNATRVKKNEMLSFGLTDTQTKAGRTLLSSKATISNVKYENGLLKVTAAFVRMNRDMSADLRIKYGATDRASSYFPLDIKNYLCFTAREEDVDISMNIVTGSFPSPTVYLQTSSDGLNWTTFTAGATSVHLAEVGERVFFRADPDHPNPTFYSNFSWEGNNFHIDKEVDVSGSIMWLLNGIEPPTEFEKEWALAYIFINNWNGCNIVNAKNLVLPATTLMDYCYYCMFDYCASLKTAPELPAMNLAESCYESMFDSTGLEEAPELPATTLAKKCYYSMFGFCESLTTAPELAAENLAVKCYSGMFQSCKNLKVYPYDFPAVDLEGSCYYQMFYKCTSLEEGPRKIEAENLADYCCYQMFYQCSSLKEAPELPAENLAYFCYDEMFSGCSSLTTAPALPAETLTNCCYLEMFSNCSSLVNAPVLKAPTLAYGCYQQMFSGCSKLSTVKMLATNISAGQCLLSWLNNAGTDSSVSSRTVKVATTDMISPVQTKCPGTWSVVLNTN